MMLRAFSPRENLSRSGVKAQGIKGLSMSIGTRPCGTRPVFLDTAVATSRPYCAQWGKLVRCFFCVEVADLHFCYWREIKPRRDGRSYPSANPARKASPQRFPELRCGGFHTSKSNLAAGPSPVAVLRRGF